MQRVDRISAGKLAELLGAVFQGPACVYEHYSQFGQGVRVFSDAKQALDYVHAEVGRGQKLVALAVHYTDAMGDVHVRRIELKPEHCDGATWRECVEGWGLVLLQLSVTEGGAIECRIASNSEKRAIAWSQTIPRVGDPKGWDWRAVARHTRRLIRVMRRTPNSALLTDTYHSALRTPSGAAKRER